MREPPAEIAADRADSKHGDATGHFRSSDESASRRLQVGQVSPSREWTIRAPALDGDIVEPRITCFRQNLNAGERSPRPQRTIGQEAIEGPRADEVVHVEGRERIADACRPAFDLAA